MDAIEVEFVDSASLSDERRARYEHLDLRVRYNEARTRQTLERSLRAAVYGFYAFAVVFFVLGWREAFAGVRWRERFKAMWAEPPSGETIWLDAVEEDEQGKA